MSLELRFLALGSSRCGWLSAIDLVLALDWRPSKPVSLPLLSEVVFAEDLCGTQTAQDFARDASMWPSTGGKFKPRSSRCNPFENFRVFRGLEAITCPRFKSQEGPGWTPAHLHKASARPDRVS